MRNIRNYNSKKVLVTPAISKYEVESNVSHASPNLSTVDSFSHRGEHQQSEQESVRELHFHKNFRMRKAAIFRCSCVLKNFAIFTRKHLRWSLFLIE